MAGIYTLTVRDYSEELSRVSFYTPAPAADGTDWAANLALLAALQAAVGAVTLGEIANEQYAAFNQVVSTATPASAFAQRELGMRLFYRDNVTGVKSHVTIPAPDMANLANPGTDDVDLTLGVMATLISAFEALVVSPAGNPVTIYAGKMVGRRN